MRLPLLLVLCPIVVGSCQLPAQQPDCHGKIGTDGRRQYWCTLHEEGSSGWALLPRPDGTRSMNELCADTTAPKDALNRYGWCDGPAMSRDQVDRLNQMSEADATAIARALNERLSFKAVSTGVDPYLDRPDILAICDLHPTDSTIANVCTSERNRCNAAGQCNDIGYMMKADEAKSMAGYANGYYMTGR